MYIFTGDVQSELGDLFRDIQDAAVSGRSYRIGFSADHSGSF